MGTWDHKVYFDKLEGGMVFQNALNQADLKVYKRSLLPEKEPVVEVLKIGARVKAHHPRDGWSKGYIHGVGKKDTTTVYKVKWDNGNVSSHQYTRDQLIERHCFDWERDV